MAGTVPTKEDILSAFHAALPVMLGYLAIGLPCGIMGLVQFAIILYAATVVFQLVTLPVEIDASRRAVAYLSAQGSSIDQEGAKQVLTAAALTYVAAALASLLQFLYLLARTQRD